MAVEAPQRAEEERRRALVSDFRAAVSRQPKAKHSHDGDNEAYVEISYVFSTRETDEAGDYFDTTTIHSFPDHLIIKKRRWNGSYTRITKAEVSTKAKGPLSRGTYAQFDETFQADLDGDMALAIFEARQNEFLPPKPEPRPE